MFILRLQLVGFRACPMLVVIEPVMQVSLQSFYISNRSSDFIPQVESIKPYWLNQTKFYFIDYLLAQFLIICKVLLIESVNNCAVCDSKCHGGICCICDTPTCVVCCKEYPDRCSCPDDLHRYIH